MSIVNFEHCGRYELREVLGEGAMGTVYRAWDPALARAVAVKVIQGWELSDDTVERFRREAQVLAKLPHPNIVGVYDVSVTGEDPFIVMELVEGRSLAALIKSGQPSPIAQHVRMMIQVCDALACAHAAGVVHRDVKPGNILVTAGGTAKLADFGIARLHDSTLTATSNVVGTPAYLSPEAFSGKPIDARTDIYGVAACLYELASGSRLHDASDIASLVAKVTQHDAPRLSAAWNDCPPALDRCLQRGLARNPDERYQRAVDFADALGKVLKELGASPIATALDVTERVAPLAVTATLPTWNRTRAAIAAAVMLLLLLIVFWPRGATTVPPSTTNEVAALTPGGTVPTATAPASVDSVNRAAPPPTAPVNAPDAATRRGPSSTRGATASTSSANPVSGPPAAPAIEDDEEEPVRRAVPIGTRVHVSLGTELRTDRSQPGHEFHGILAEPISFDGTVVAPTGTALRGIVDEVRQRGGGRPPSFRLSLSELLIAGTPTRVRTARYEVIGPDNTPGGASLTTLILGAAAGALIGGMTGGNRGLVGGAAIGAAAASRVREAPQPGELVLSNPLIFKLAEPLLLAAKPD